jgi:mRNA-degrading endonuclease YafQ of YafQ-DinJ toxin-antitoxin module
MEIKYARKFLRKYSRLTRIEKQQVKKIIGLFQRNIRHPSLRLHKLNVELFELWTISVNMRLRVLFVEKGGFLEVIFIDIGGHEIYQDY